MPGGRGTPLLMTPPADTPTGPPVAEPSAALVREWTACALVRAATRFLPVPVLDDAVAERATRVAVSRTLRAHGRSYAPTAVAPLYADRRRGLFRRLASIPRRILLFPVRKFTRIAGAVTGVPTDISRVLLLGRATHRRLALGELQGPASPALTDEARRVRTAFEAVVDEMDLRLLRGAVSDALSGVKDLSGAVVDYARQRFGSDDATADGASSDPSSPAQAPEPVAEGTEQVEQVLHRPEVVQLLAEFDRRMDDRLGSS